MFPACPRAKHSVLLGFEFEFVMSGFSNLRLINYRKQGMPEEEKVGVYLLIFKIHYFASFHLCL